MQWAKARPKEKAAEAKDKEERTAKVEKEMKKGKEKEIATIVDPQDISHPNAPTPNPSNSRGIAMGAANGDTGGQSAVPK